MTTTATQAPPATRASSTTGWWTLVRFMLRRDRFRIAVWALTPSLITAGSMQTFLDTYGEPDARAMLEATMDNPAMIALTGRNYAPGEYTIGVMTGQQMLVWTLLTVAIMSVVLMVRHTRLEESTGRADLVRAGVVGRHATSFAAYKAVATANLVVALAITIAVGTVAEPSMDWHGALLYGACHVVTGLVFASIALVCVQVSEYPRGVTGLGLAVIGAAFVIRGMGDVANNGLSWLSPFGWAQATHVYHDNRWWPLLIGLAAAVVVAASGLWLSTRRDVGAGLRAPQAAPATANTTLTRPWSFTLRLQRGMIFGWIAGMVFLGLSYGAVLGDVESFMEQFEQLEEVFAMGEGVDPLASFQSTMMMVMAVIASSAAVLAAQRLRGEEADGRIEPLLVVGLSRTRLLASYVATAVVTGVLVVVAAGAGMGLAGAASTGSVDVFTSSVVASIAYAPALWMVSGITFLVVGWAPRATAWSWTLVAYAFVAVYLRGLMGLPEWLESFSPFGYVARYPLENWAVAPWVVMTLLAGVFVVVAAVGFNRRDLQSGA